MAEETLRGSSGSTVLVLSDLLHGHARQKKRICPHCQSEWSMEHRKDERPRIWRNASEVPDTLLDWVGNNAAVECCYCRERPDKNALKLKLTRSAYGSGRPRPSQLRNAVFGVFEDRGTLNVAAIFRSSRFSLEPPVENGVPYDVPLGDDLAAELALAVQRVAPQLRADQPIREDWGTVMDILADGERYRVSVQWLGYRHADAEETWGFSVSNPTRVGCLGMLLQKRLPARHEGAVRDALAKALASEPGTFEGVEWLTQAEYDRRV